MAPASVVDWNTREKLENNFKMPHPGSAELKPGRFLYLNWNAKHKNTKYFVKASNPGVSLQTLPEVNALVPLLLLLDL